MPDEVLPTVGQPDWGPTLNGVLADLDHRLQSVESAASGVGQPVVRAFQFDHATAGLNTGVTVYTPAVGEILLNAWVEVDSAWDGTTPHFDAGTFTDGNGWWLYENFPLPLDASMVDVVNTIDAASLISQGNAAGNLHASSLMYLGISNGGLSTSPNAFARHLPAKFIAANPVKVVVSQDGTSTGLAAGSTTGSATFYLATVVPATAGA